MKKLLIIVALLGTLCCTSCRKTCRCYGFDGSVDEYSREELSELGRTCSGMENINFGLTYSICEFVLF